MPHASKLEDDYVSPWVYMSPCCWDIIIIIIITIIIIIIIIIEGW